MRGLIPVAALILAAGTAVAAPPGAGTISDYIAAFNAADDEIYVNAIPNAEAEAFLAANVPLFECPDADIERTYYFRWWTYRKHLRRTPEGWVVTEFLPDVSWARTYNTIICALGHHIMEGRWLRDSSVIRDYVRFWFTGGGRDYTTLYTSWPALALAERAKVTGDPSDLDELLEPLVGYLRKWTDWFGRVPPGAGSDDRLTFACDWREGSEVSLGGDGFRPLVNSVVWGEATTLGRVARRLGRTGLAEICETTAATCERSVKSLLWHPDRNFFTVLDTNGVHKTVRELHGYMPWYVGMPLAGYEAAWAPLMDENGFRAPFGLPVSERSDPGFTLNYAGVACEWNGPSWPFATSFTLTALANAIRAGYPLPVGKGDFVTLLRQYAAQQRLTREDGTTVPWIDENLNPLTGDWLHRTKLLLNHVTRPEERGKDYNHSTFCDLVISGLAGLVPQEGDELVVDPFFPPDWDYLALENVRYHGHDISIRWDRTGERYGTQGLSVRVDGAVVASSKTPERLACAPHAARYGTAELLNACVSNSFWCTRAYANPHPAVATASFDPGLDLRLRTRTATGSSDCACCGGTRNVSEPLDGFRSDPRRGLLLRLH